MFRYFVLLLLIVSFQVFSQDINLEKVKADIPDLQKKLAETSKNYKKCPRTIILSQYLSRGPDLEYFNYASKILLKLLQDKINEKENAGLIISDAKIRLSVSIDTDGSIISFNVLDIKPLQDIKKIEEQFNDIAYKFENSNPEESCIKYQILLTIDYVKN